MTPERLAHLLSKPLPDPLKHVLLTNFDQPMLPHALRAFGETSAIEKTELHGRSGLYMTRYFLEERSDGGRVYLHEIHRADEDEEYHDHPWGFTAHVLVGGYIESRLWFTHDHVDGQWQNVIVPKPLIHDANDLLFGSYDIDASIWHRIESLRGHGSCWSVIITKPKEKSWSFFNPRTKVTTPWRDFIKRKGLEVVGEEAPPTP